MKICVGVAGSIAAYRSPDLVKELVKRGHEVQVVLTQAARELVSDRVLATFSGKPVLSDDVFGADHTGTDHISTARWAEVFIVYGATADLMGRYAAGLAGDFLTLQLLATQTLVILAPAMNPAMWAHPAVRQNAQTLQSRGVKLVGPIQGVVACGESGIGHIAELNEIIRAIEGQPTKKFLEGKKLLLSAGPMRTKVDSVRYLQNRSSGQMGLEVARAAREAGARVQVLLGPVDSQMEARFSGFELYRYEGPAEYRAKLPELFRECDIFISLAAVLDFEILPQGGKIDREALTQSSSLSLPMRPVEDFVAAMAKIRQPHQTVIAFAAETGTSEQIRERAERKMLKKSVTALVANPVTPGLGPDASDNLLWVLRPGVKPQQLGPAPKSQLARPLLEALLS